MCQSIFSKSGKLKLFSHFNDLPNLENNCVNLDSRKGNLSLLWRRIQVAGGAPAVLRLLPFFFDEAVDEFLRDRECQPLLGAQFHDLAAQLQVVPDLAPRTLRLEYAKLRSVCEKGAHGAQVVTL